tara:strand:+ start:11834 stop:12391 length:558 start_codon:yes stop_codon:yes gene_type:complete
MSSANVPIDKISSLLQLRFDRTLKFIEKSKFKPNKILDLGPDNTFAKILRTKGFEVVNTGFNDLDDYPEIVQGFKDIDCITSFEIFEHLVAPYNVLRKLPKVKMFISVPLKLWFSPAYNNKNDKWDRHYHEFEDWQFDWLLEKSGWKINRYEKWNSPTKEFGLRPILRKFYPRYYVMEVDPNTIK